MAVATFAGAVPAAAQDATWVGGTPPGPAASNYGATANWNPATVPSGTATFGASANTDISIGGAYNVGGWTFGPGASAYTFAIDIPGQLIFTGAGINIGGGSASITNNALLQFNNSSTAGTASITNNFSLWFFGSSTAGSASITNTGALQFFNNSSGGNAAVTNAGPTATTYFDLTSGLGNDHKVSVGSIAGDGTFRLGQNELTVGSNNLSTTVSGAIIDGPAGTGGSLVKIGAGTLTLSGNNTYSGGTLISAGVLQATNASSVGTGAVTLDGGAFRADGLTDLTFTNNFKVNTTGGTVDNNGTLLTLSGIIANGNGGTGVLQITDTSGGFGTTVLSGVNSHTGGTLVSGTTVQVTNNNSVGSGTVTLDNGQFQADGISDLTFINNFKINNTPLGSAIDSNGTTLTIAGNIADGNGPGALTISDFGGGRVILTGNNTYTGGTTICACATLQIGTLATMGSIVGEVNNEGQFDIVNAHTSGITKITNDGSLGPAITTFHNATTASSATVINVNGGLTQFIDASSAGNAVFNNSNGGTVAFGNVLSPPGGLDTSTAANAVIDNFSGGAAIFLAHSDAGHASITNHGNGGSTQFFESSSAASATIVNQAGSLTAFFENSTAANARIDNSGVTYFGTSGFSPLDAPTAANATIVNQFGGFLIFDAHATAGNATITNLSGSDQTFAAFATAGNATITTNSGAWVGFLDNSTGGNAQFITVGTGFVDFSGSLGPNGDGRITAGSIAGSGSYFIGGNTLVVGSNNLSSEVSGVIADFDPCGCRPAGPGALTKVGAGNLILSGINSYTGATVIDGGRLSVNGSILSSSGVTVNAGGSLGGNGIVGNTTINGGALAPGNSIGLLTVHGSLVFTAASSYMVEVSPANADRTNVIGAATLGGAAVNASFAAGSYVARQYTILNATGGISGTFNPLVNTGLSNLTADLSYDTNNVFLNVALNFGSGLNVNQQSVANTLANLFNAGGAIPVTFASLTPNGLSQVSGETATGSQQSTFDAMNIFLGLLTDPFVAGRGDGFGGNAGAAPFAEESATTLAYAARKKDAGREAFAKFPAKADVARNDLFEQRWSVWGAAYGGGSRTEGNATLGSNNATARAFGFVAGADYRISPATLAGFALAGGGTSFGVSGFGSGRSDMFQAGAFVRHNVGPAYVTAALAYAWQDVTTDRMVTVAGVDRLRAEFDANAYSGRVEGGYRFVTPWMGVTPYAAGQFTTFSLPAYAEQVLSGAGTFALNYAAKDVTASRTELGFRTDKSFAVQSGIFTLRGRAAWAHDFNTDRNVAAVFQTLPGASFIVNGAAQAHDSALATASAEMKWLNGWFAAATFEGQFSNVTNSYAGKGVVRYAW